MHKDICNIASCVFKNDNMKGERKNIMKKIIMIMIVVCLVCSVCACGVNSSNISNKSVQEDSINKDNHKESETEIENKINSINNNSTSEQKKSSIEYKNC